MNTFKIYIWRSGREQFLINQPEWMNKYKDYFEVIDDGVEPLINCPFKIASIPLLDIDNNKATEAKGLLSIVKNLDDLDYDYIGFVHMDFLPMYLNERYWKSKNIDCYPTIKGPLFDFNTVVEKITNTDKELLISLQMLNLYSTILCHFKDWNMRIDNKDMWQFLAEKYDMLDVHKLTREQLNEPVAICNAVIGTKEYWRTYKVFLDDLDQYYNVSKYHTFECKCQNKERLTGHLLEAFTELNVIKYLTEHNDVQIQLIPVCHINH